ncbi:hypothetical protein GLOTRDRAFT_131164 [Gloeophyllum trabeum ATCC 11539]|uniref:Protein kinase domain-containing protein n=1 Tax=Gloeophyllum trabeum (strain ATCC 11539 / FP-39264 / Madison 617) TaxID=670483 RepID=S7RM92_GLOTA|nr:uncharacterized protein GLOTRDRAFT_131164 [Gloeophyllum trabeum ATCC 11539]EPQ53834.1 hypothetical protein GLOTRDRAFT_131164 [Gloeophyllum trabeum ATCC 11539]
MSEGDIYRAIYRGEPGEETDGVPGVARFYDDFDVPAPDTGKPQSTAAARLNEERGDRFFTKRVLRRCVLLSVGIPLHRFKSTKQLLLAIRDAINGHRNMCQKGVIHRDISPNNIMISVDPERDGHGFLIDPELALAPTMANYAEESTIFTGTLAFVANERLAEIETAVEEIGLRAVKTAHQAWHDLESVFWVLLFILLRHTQCRIEGGDRRKHLTDTFDMPNHTHRNGLLADIMQSMVVTRNTPLTLCIRRLAEAVFSHYMPFYVKLKFREDEINLLRHEHIIDKLQAALDSEGWPDEETDGAIAFEQTERQSAAEKKIVASPIVGSLTSAMKAGVFLAPAKIKASRARSAPRLVAAAPRPARAPHGQAPVVSDIPHPPAPAARRSDRLATKRKTTDEDKARSSSKKPRRAGAGVCLAQDNLDAPRRSARKQSNSSQAGRQGASAGTRSQMRAKKA